MRGHAPPRLPGSSVCAARADTHCAHLASRQDPSSPSSFTSRKPIAVARPASWPWKMAPPTRTLPWPAKQGVFSSSSTPPCTRVVALKMGRRCVLSLAAAIWAHDDTPSRTHALTAARMRFTARATGGHSNGRDVSTSYAPFAECPAVASKDIVVLGYARGQGAGKVLCDSCDPPAERARARAGHPSQRVSRPSSTPPEDYWSSSEYTNFDEFDAKSILPPR